MMATSFNWNDASAELKKSTGMTIPAELQRHRGRSYECSIPFRRIPQQRQHLANIRQRLDGRR
jgi:hypothetical protein